MRIIYRYRSTVWVRYAAVFAGALVVFGSLQAIPGFADPDSFYHIKMAELIARQGIVYDFSWLRFTTLTEIYIDHHLLYHIFLIPFVVAFGPVLGGQTATALLGALVIIALFLLLRSFNVKHPELFVGLALLSTPFLFRLSLIKASGMALLFLLLGVWAMHAKRWKTLGAISFLYVFVHGGFIVLFCLALIFVASKTTYKYFISQKKYAEFVRRVNIFRFKISRFTKLVLSRTNLLTLCVIGAAMIVALLASPYFPTVFLFLKQQLLQIGLSPGVYTLRVGAEWHAYSSSQFFTQNALIIFSFLVGVVYFFGRIKKQNTLSLFLLITTCIFLFYSIKSIRFIEYFIPFAVLFVGVQWSRLIPELFSELRGRKMRLAGKIVIISGLTIIAVYQSYLFTKLYNSLKGIPVDTYAVESRWLVEHTDLNDIVFHSDWDEFPALFYHNHHNRYIVGLDPTFMYNKDPELYMLYNDIVLGKRTVGIDREIRSTFQAKYVIIDRTHDSFMEAVGRDTHFVKEFEGRDAVIYSIR